MDLRYSLVLKECLKNRYWINGDTLRSSIFGLDASNHDLNHIRVIIENHFTTETDRDRFSKFVQANIHTTNHLSGISITVYLFIGASFAGLFDADSLTGYSATFLYFMFLWLIAVATIYMNISGNTKYAKLKLIEQLIDEINNS